MLIFVKSSDPPITTWEQRAIDTVRNRHGRLVEYQSWVASVARDLIERFPGGDPVGSLSFLFYVLYCPCCLPRLVQSPLMTAAAGFESPPRGQERFLVTYILDMPFHAEELEVGGAFEGLAYERALRLYRVFRLGGWEGASQAFLDIIPEGIYLLTAMAWLLTPSLPKHSTTTWTRLDTKARPSARQTVPHIPPPAPAVRPRAPRA